MKIKLSQYAKNKNICYKTAWMQAKNGEIPIEKTETGQIYVLDDSVPERTLDDIIADFHKEIKNFFKNKK